MIRQKKERMIRPPKVERATPPKRQGKNEVFTQVLNVTSANTGEITGKNFYVKLPSGETREFIYDEKVKHIHNFHTQKKMNDKALRKYIVERSGEKAGKLNKSQQKEIREKALKDIPTEERSFIHTHIYKTTKTRLLQSKSQQDIEYDYMYLRVKIKIFYDGWYRFALGNSDYQYNPSYYKPELNKGKPFTQGGEISDTKLKLMLYQAVKRALAQGGSYDARFKIISVNFCYHQGKKVLEE